MSNWMFGVTRYGALYNIAVPSRLFHRRTPPLLPSMGSQLAILSLIHMTSGDMTGWPCVVLCYDALIMVSFNLDIPQLHQAHMKHELLTKIMQKDHDHTRRLRDVRERVAKQKEAQRLLRDRRLQAARVRKYYK